MAHRFHASIRKALTKVLIPLVDLALRHSVSIQDFQELLREAYVSRGERFLRARESKVNTMRLSALTGLHRKEVSRLTKGTTPKSPPHAGLLSRVVGMWLTDPRFQNRGPRSLTYKGSASEFYSLVSSITTDVSPTSIRNHLLDVGMVSIDESEKLVLEKSAYVPNRSLEQSFEILQLDFDDLITAVEQNLENRNASPNLHMTTDYDEVSAGDAEELRAWILQEGVAFHERFREKLKNFDCSLNPGRAGDNENFVKVTLGTFSTIRPEVKEMESVTPLKEE